MWHHRRFVCRINYLQTVLTKCNSVVERNNNFVDFSVQKPYQTIRVSHYLTAKYNGNNDDNNNRVIIIKTLIILNQNNNNNY